MLTLCICHWCLALPVLLHRAYDLLNQNCLRKHLISCIYFRNLRWSVWQIRGNKLATSEGLRYLNWFTQLKTATQCMQPHNVCSHTMYAATQCIQPHNVCSHTMYAATQCIQPHNVYSHTTYTATKCMKPHNVCSHTMYAATQCTQPHNVCSHTMYAMSASPNNYTHRYSLREGCCERERRRTLTFWRRNYFLNFSTACI